MSGSGRWLLRILGAVLLLWPLLSSCTWRSVQPVVKIGLLAPFEGLHRRTGYEALAAMRLALAQYNGTQIKVIPLALHLDFDTTDDLAKARRTMAKLLADRDVHAVIGPYDPRLEAMIAEERGHEMMPWLLPLRLDITKSDPAAMFALDGNHLAATVALVVHVAEQAAALGATKLVLAGGEGQWQQTALTDALASTTIALPYTIVTESTTPEIDDTPTAALLWLGVPEKVVSAFEQGAMNLRNWQSIWFGPLGGDPVLPERLFRNQLIRDELIGQVGNNIYWATWLDANASTDSRSLSPTAYLTYRATEAALATIDLSYPFVPVQWQIGIFQLQADGGSRPLQRERYYGKQSNVGL